jgi:isopentenyl diphosphate isomerase/L-lactate dehydrogenase-like FMN-dependent dehydrogenase
LCLKDRDITASLVQRAEAAECKAIVLSVDVPAPGKRERDIRNRFTLPDHLSMKDLLPAGCQELPKNVAGSGLAAFLEPNVRFVDAPPCANSKHRAATWKLFSKGMPLKGLDKRSNLGGQLRIGADLRDQGCSIRRITSEQGSGDREADGAIGPLTLGRECEGSPVFSVPGSFRHS